MGQFRDLQLVDDQVRAWGSVFVTRDPCLVLAADGRSYAPLVCFHHLKPTLSFGSRGLLVNIRSG